MEEEALQKKRAKLTKRSKKGTSTPRVLSVSLLIKKISRNKSMGSRKVVVKWGVKVYMYKEQGLRLRLNLSGDRKHSDLPHSHPPPTSYDFFDFVKRAFPHCTYLFTAPHHKVCCDEFERHYKICGWVAYTFLDKILFFLNELDTNLSG